MFARYITYKESEVKMSKPYTSGNEIRHATYYTCITEDSEYDYYKTVEDNETIDLTEWFVENGNVDIHSNCLIIYSIDSKLRISLNDSKYISIIPIGHNKEFSYMDVCKFTVHCPVDTKIYFEIQNF